MAIEHEHGKYHCKFVYHESGRAPLRRRIREVVIVANNGHVHRFKDEELPTEISIGLVESEEGGHILDVLYDRPNSRRFFGFIPKLKLRDMFFMWFGAFFVTSLLFVFELIVAAHRHYM